MNAAEFKTLREYLGISSQWIADQLSVSLRAVQHWESGRNAVDTNAAALLIRIDNLFEEKIEFLIAQVYDLSAKNRMPETMTLTRYRNDSWQLAQDILPLPACSHATLIARMRRALLKEGIHVQIEYGEVDEKTF